MDFSDTYLTAYKYLTLGHCVIPSGGGPDGKKAMVSWKEYQERRPDEAQLEAWENAYHPTVWAMPTGPVSGCFVVDCDRPEAVALMKAAGLQPHVKTRKGFHYYCRLPSFEIGSPVGILPGVDIRAKGSYVNFCGRNANAEYSVLVLPEPDTLIPFEKLPKELQTALAEDRKGPQRPAETVAEIIPQGKRNATLASIAGTMRARGLSEEIILVTLMAENMAHCQPPLDDDEVRDIARKIGRYQPRKKLVDQPAQPAATAAGDQPGATTKDPGPVEKAEADPLLYTLTDRGNGARFARMYRGRVLYSPERKMWLIYNGRYWEWDLGMISAMRLAKACAMEIYAEAAKTSDDERRKQIVDHAHRSEGNVRLQAMLNLAQSELGMSVMVDKLDCHDNLLNCANGTIDLKTGAMAPHKAEDMLTAYCRVTYSPHARSELWETFLDTIFAGRPAVRDYVQRALGYSATGYQDEQTSFQPYGAGANGKSTLLNAVAHTLGADYACEIEPRVFMVSSQDTPGPNEAVAKLYRKRLAISTEVEEGQKLSVTLIKRMTGGEKIYHEKKYEHGFEFLPTHKLWLSGNHRPVITDTTWSIWRRVKLIDFEITIPEEQRNKQLPDLLKKPDAQKAILAWIVAGAVQWATNGLGEPPEIARATDRYREEMDVLNDWMLERCMLDKQAVISTITLYKGYKEWCAANEVTPLGKQKFGRRLEEKGIAKVRGTANKLYWKGIRLLISDEIAAGPQTQTAPAQESLLPAENGQPTEIRWGEDDGS